MIVRKIIITLAAVFFGAMQLQCSCDDGGNGVPDADARIDDVPVEDLTADDARVDDVPVEDVRIDDAPADEALQDPVEEDVPSEDVQEEELEPYTCVPDTACRNGSEECDDQGFSVPSEGQLVLVCIEGDNGIAFISATTGPACTDEESCSGTDGNNRPRCQGYEKCLCVHFWDHADYNPLYTLECTEPGLMLDVDLTPGEHLYIGVHDNPDGGGHMNEVCLGVRNH